MQLHPSPKEKRSKQNGKRKRKGKPQNKRKKNKLLDIVIYSDGFDYIGKQSNSVTE